MVPTRVFRIHENGLSYWLANKLFCWLVLGKTVRKFSLRHVDNPPIPPPNTCVENESVSLGWGQLCHS
jgi:hypothetical protein